MCYCWWLFPLSIVLNMSENLDDHSKTKESSELDSIKSVYNICIETRNFEINQLIQRNNFFMLFQGVLLGAVVQSSANKPVVELIVCIAGFAVSCYQLQMACGAKFWQEWWEYRVNYFENMLKEHHYEKHGHFKALFDTPFEEVRRTVADHFSSRKRDAKFTDFLILRAFAVGRAPIKTSLALIFAWSALTVHTINFDIFKALPGIAKGFYIKPPSLEKKDSNSVEVEKKSAGSSLNQP